MFLANDIRSQTSVAILWWFFSVSTTGSYCNYIKMHRSRMNGETNTNDSNNWHENTCCYLVVQCLYSVFICIIHTHPHPTHTLTYGFFFTLVAVVSTKRYGIVAEQYMLHNTHQLCQKIRRCEPICVSAMNVTYITIVIWFKFNPHDTRSSFYLILFEALLK